MDKDILGEWEDRFFGQPAFIETIARDPANS
ncbi:hypothetical protein F441_10822 [Phytophthora nicotianae CJ01A1]|uniref:Uncharacterized protein n=1 Tax=Phytophthora nicotianae CJ01A1 TaxID=1317063 RepID=W2WVA6_PHYNI|nr:hypothetical protein F441_10822 [Phytophthora nicotianae CJ01A1]